MPDNASAGATPAAAGATSAQTTPVSPAPETVTTSTPATGEEALGDPGKAALAAERAAAKAEKARADKAERALAELQNATASESEKALKVAKAEGAAEVSQRLTARIRRSEVKVALAAAGINPSVLDLAVNASDFERLVVSDDGEVEGIDEAVKTFKGTHGDLFKPVAAAGSADLGTGSATRTSSGKTFSREQLRDPLFYQANKDDILKAMQEGRITG